MKELEFEIRFNTPAFIGDAQQESEWRTPPIKALMRYWWRFIWASKNKPHPNDLNTLRECENQLFGDTQKQARVRIRLSEGGSRRDSIENNRSYNYLRYGKDDKRAIGVGDVAKLEIAVTDDYESDIRSVMSIIHDYGTIGGRSTNGWGSIALRAHNQQILQDSHKTDIFSDWKIAIEKPWPHAIGMDEERNPLVWEMKKTFPEWESVMNELTGLRKRVNQIGKDRNMRHELSYPVKSYPRNDGVKRLPNALRFKVRSYKTGNNRVEYRGLVYFVPMTPKLNKSTTVRSRNEIICVWEEVFNYLDEEANNFQRFNP